MSMNHIKNNLLYKLLSYVYHNFYLKIIFKLEELIYNDKKVSSNKIVIDNFAGKGFGDNPKYIVKELLKKDMDLDIVWEVSNINTPMPEGVRKVKYGTPKAYKELLTAKIWIDNIKNSFKPQKKEKQFYLQTWHGGLALKAVEKQVEGKLDPEYVKAAKRDARMTDLMLSDSKWTTEQYSKYFWYDGNIIKTGFPRNDILISKPHSIVNKVYKTYKISSKNKILLYAPTFRDNSNTLKTFEYDFSNIISELRKKFGYDYILLVKLHPNIAQLIQNSSEALDLGIDYFDVSNYADMQELLLASDVLITDYSSCMFDAMLAKKKVFLLAKDFDEYIKNDRNLLFDLKKDIPFTFSDNEADLITKIKTFDTNLYLNNIENFERDKCILEDGKASNRVAEILRNKVGDR